MENILTLIADNLDSLVAMIANHAETVIDPEIYQYAEGIMNNMVVNDTLPTFADIWNMTVGIMSEVIF